LEKRYRVSSGLIALSLFLAIVFLWPPIGAFTGMISGATLTFALCFVLLELVLLLLVHQSLRFYSFTESAIVTGLPFLKSRSYSLKSIRGWYFQKGGYSSEIVFQIGEGKQMRIPFSGRGLKKQVDILVERLKPNFMNAVSALIEKEGLEIGSNQENGKFRIGSEGVHDYKGNRLFLWTDLKNIEITKSEFSYFFRMEFEDKEFRFGQNLGHGTQELIDYLFSKKEKSASK
jgi:hypothetical protein